MLVEDRPIVNMDNLDPTSIFEKFFTREIFEEIKTKTNNYARDNPYEKTQYKWRDVTVEDMRKFFGIMIMMGIDKKPSYHMHWKSEDAWDSNLIKSTMTRDRFQYILGKFCIGSPSKDDKLARIRKLADHIEKTSRELYTPRRNLAIDESMIGFRGRHSLKQYMPNKPTKYGFKAFLLCESVSGYCLSCIFFCGKGDDQFKIKPLCLKLVSGYENVNHHVFTDNYYTSVGLADLFFERGIYLTGTLRKKKNDMPNIDAIMKERSKVCFLKKDYKTLVLWNDNRLVRMLSSYYSPSMTYKEGYRCWKKTEIHIPLMTHEYNNFMKGVDRFDQKLGLYSYPHKSRKWWKYFFTYLLNMVLINSYILY